MAKLQVSVALLLNALFGGTQPHLEVLGCKLDSFSDTFEIDLAGPTVPDAKEIICIYQKQSLTTRFEPRNNQHGQSTALR